MSSERIKRPWAEEVGRKGTSVVRDGEGKEDK